jgi:hypothetical protein
MFLYILLLLAYPRDILDAWLLDRKSKIK